MYRGHVPAVQGRESLVNQKSKLTREQAWLASEFRHDLSCIR